MLYQTFKSKQFHLQTGFLYNTQQQQGI